MKAPDLTPYPPGGPTPGETPPKVPALCVGWLDAEQPFPTAPPQPELVARLWGFAAYPVLATAGVHDCPFCADGLISKEVSEGRWIAAGSAEIRVFDGSAWFAAPNLVGHYVEVHHYAPPASFLRAVLQGPAPFSPEYEQLLDRYHDLQGWPRVRPHFSSGPWVVMRSSRSRRRRPVADE